MNTSEKRRSLDSMTIDAAALIRAARRDAVLTLRELARRAGTSHSTISAYEAGTKTPTVATLDRILSAAGFAADLTLRPRVRTADDIDRGDELIAVLELASHFPASPSATLDAPVFSRQR